MKASFHLSNNKECEIDTIPGGDVAVRFYDLSDYETRREQFVVLFGRHEARSVASAIMGCAAGA